MTSIFSIINKETYNRKVILQPTLMYRICASTGGHILNIMNMDSDPPISSQPGGKENFRNNLIFMCSSGFGKSVSFRTMLKPGYGILSEQTFFNTSIRSTFSKESWMGTAVKDKDGTITATNGVFQRFARGIIGADDYQAMKLIFDGEGLGNDEVYLMTALDTDTATKDLSYMNIEVKGIALTIWVGMRPTEITLKSGVARRFSFEMFFPSRMIAEKYRQHSRSHDSGVVSDVRQDIAKATADVCDNISYNGSKPIDYSEVNFWLSSKDIPHFEENIFRRLSVGMAVSMGEYPDIRMSPQLEGLLESEYLNRNLLRINPFSYMVYCILRDEPGECILYEDLERFLKRYYQMTQVEALNVMRWAKMTGTVKIDNDIRGRRIMKLKKGVVF